ncbi:MAG TPA: histidine phosphatase family protein [Methylomirabilota bacterium]|nr:histidine phosphatase family protein [Methylomirabilota bacterium]
MSVVTPLRLFLIRHGEVEPKYHKVFGGRIDMELSPLGHEQVRALAQYCNRFTLDKVYASPMRRVKQTMAPLLEITGHEPVILPGLREVDFGVWTGLSWDAVTEKYNCSAFEWLDKLEAGEIAEAESTRDFRARVDEALRTILGAPNQQNVAVVCHGGVIRMLLSILLGLPLQRMAGFDIEYASITSVLYRPNKVEVQLLNLTPWRDL